MKISMTGRPGRVIEQGNVIITAMQQNRAPALPKGLPDPPTDPTIYTLYFTRKQWERVNDVVADPEDLLIIEGVTHFDRDLATLAIFVTRATTKVLETARRQKKRQAKLAAEAAASETEAPSNNQSSDDLTKP